MAPEVPTSPISIVADMQARNPPRPARDDVVRKPEPRDKPDPRAQWDETVGRWEVWDDDAGAWVSLDDGTLQPPGSASVDHEGTPIVHRPDDDPA